MKCTIICYTLKKTTPTTRNKFKRELLGYTDHSNKGKYKYKRKGILQNIPHLRPIRSTIIIENKNKQKIIKFLQKYNAIYHTFNTTLQPHQFKN